MNTDRDDARHDESYPELRAEPPSVTAEVIRARPAPMPSRGVSAALRRAAWRGGGASSS